MSKLTIIYENDDGNKYTREYKNVDEFYTYESVPIIDATISDILSYVCVNMLQDMGYGISFDEKEILADFRNICKAVEDGTINLEQLDRKYNPEDYKDIDKC